MTRGIRFTLITKAEADAAHEALDAASLYADTHGTDGGWGEAHHRLMKVGRARANTSARLALGRSVHWDRAGRVYFGLTPGCAQELAITLTRLRPLWDTGGRRTAFTRWFLRRLEGSK